MIYFITLFGIRKVLFFSPIVKVSRTGTENTMELFGYSLEEWFLITACMGIGAFWLAMVDNDDG
jgi:hypothetical protein